MSREEYVSLLNQDDITDLLSDYLRSRINDLCSDIAAKFSVYDLGGRPRKAFIIDTLMKYSCIECITKIFTQQYKHKGDIDAIYKENHRLAVNLLTEHLQHCLSEEGFKISVQDEVEGDYGRVDVLLRPTNSGVFLKYKGIEIIVEIKTGKGLSYDQIFRYLIDRPNATIIVWRVMMRQIVTIDQKRTNQLLPAYLETIIRRGTRLLDGDKVTQCGHNHTNEKPYVIENPEELLNNFASALSETMPKVIDTILQMLKTYEYARYLE